MATAILGILITPIVEIAKCLLRPIERRIGYIVHYHKNVRGLRNEVKELVKIRDAIRKQADEALRRGETINFAVEEWLKKVDEIVSDVEKKLDDQDNVKISYESNCSPHLRSRCKLSKEAGEKMGMVRELQEDGTFSSVSHPGPPPGIDQTLAGYFEAFESTKLAMEQIMASLDNDQLDVVGVYGMGGVGKTTLMLEVVKQAKRNQKFDEVVLTTVSQNLDLKRLQTEIAEQLGLKLDEESLSVRALRLVTRLKLEKRVLIILDDVWERLELVQVGIPHGAEHRGCKIVVTTRSLDVCNDIDCKSNINVKILNEEDSWKLFKMVVGNMVDSPALHSISEEVAQECGGLPIALVTLGRALRNKEKSRWEETLRALRISKPVDIKGMNEKVVLCIKLSFDHIRSEEGKMCFLYCCLFPEDHDIKVEQLVLCLMGEGLFEDVDTVEEGRIRVHAIIDSLKASCLLLGSTTEECVKMHDVVRDAAISIASSNVHGFMAKSNSNLTNWSRPRNSNHVKRISLAVNNISKFPYQIEYPILLTMLVISGTSLVEIPNDFFMGMKALKVLYLSGNLDMNFSLTSLRCIRNLKMLCLESMRLEDASVIGEMTTLEILSLRGSILHFSPKEIRTLTNLKFLDLTLMYACCDLTFPPSVISNLSQLEELYLGRSFTSWQVDELQCETVANLAEVLSLEHLTTLQIYISNHNCLFKDFANYRQNLKTFSIEVGAESFNYHLTPNVVILNLRGNIEAPKPLGNWAKAVLQKTEQLYLLQWEGLQNVEQLHIEDFNCLASLEIHSCSINTISSSKFLEKFVCLQTIHVTHCLELKEIFHCNGLNHEKLMLPCLEKVHLVHLPKLISIWRGINPSLFQNLQHIVVDGCSKLLKLLTPTYAEVLRRLVRLDLYNCEEMATIISSDEKEDLATCSNKILLPQLHTLVLSNLPEIANFIQPEILLDFPSLDWLAVYSCPKLKRLPFGPRSLCRLRKFKAERTWFDDLEFKYESVKTHLEHCFQELEHVDTDSDLGPNGEISSLSKMRPS